MKPIKCFLGWGLITFSLTLSIHAQQQTNKSQTLAPKQQAIVSISAFTANGDLLQLQKELSNGLDAGMSINEIKEVLVHLSAYCGFPRSLQGINTFMSVLESRKAKGITDKLGKEASPVKFESNKYEEGIKVLEKLTGQQVQRAGYAAFAPVIDTLLKENLFAEIFGRDILTYLEREIATISALISLGGVEPMLQGHMRIGLNLGMTETELKSLLSLIDEKVGKAEADAGGRVLLVVTKSNLFQNPDTSKASINIFAKGVRAPASNFTGTVWVNMLLAPQEGLNSSIGVVMFEPGARTNWHKHPGGQILLVTEGKGYYQEKGQPIKIIQKGDVVKCPLGVEHWHGALPDTKLTHVAVVPNADKGNAVWLQRVTDEEYSNVPFGN